MIAGLGVLCLLAAVGLGLVLAVVNTDGYLYWPEGSSVPVDGNSHVVPVETGSELYVWSYAGETRPQSCTFNDASTDATVEVTDAPSGWTRSGGTAADYSATLAGQAPLSGQLVVRCDDTGASPRCTSRHRRARRLSTTSVPGGSWSWDWVSSAPACSSSPGRSGRSHAGRIRPCSLSGGGSPTTPSSSA